MADLAAVADGGPAYPPNYAFADMPWAGAPNPWDVLSAWNRRQGGQKVGFGVQGMGGGAPSGPMVPGPFGTEIPASQWRGWNPFSRIFAPSRPGSPLGFGLSAPDPVQQYHTLLQQMNANPLMWRNPQALQQLQSLRMQLPATHPDSPQHPANIARAYSRGGFPSANAPPPGPRGMVTTPPASPPGSYQQALSNAYRRSGAIPTSQGPPIAYNPQVNVTDFYHQQRLRDEALAQQNNAAAMTQVGQIGQKLGASNPIGAMDLAYSQGGALPATGAAPNALLQNYASGAPIMSAFANPQVGAAAAGMQGGGGIPGGVPNIAGLSPRSVRIDFHPPDTSGGM